jgi:rhomboid protease GluP
MGSWRRIRPAWLLAIIILVGWLIGTLAHQFCLVHSGSNCQIYADDYLAQNNDLVYYSHAYYQMFTSILVTYNQVDAAFNAIAVLILDRITEDNLNKTRYFLIFFSTAFFGNLLTLLQGPNYSSAGASGGIFGIYAALITFSWLKDKHADVPALILFVVIFVGSSILGNVNYVAHIGGAIGGFLAAGILFWSLKPTITEYSMAYDSRPATILVTVVLLVLVTLASAAQFLAFVGR